MNTPHWWVRGVHVDIDDPEMALAKKHKEEQTKVTGTRP
jgi:hypothetical protein